MKLTIGLLFACQVLICLQLQQQQRPYGPGGAGLVDAAAKTKSKCPAARHLEMDACAARMGFLGDHSFKVPKNETAASAFCQQLKESIGCIQSYSRDCLQGFTKQILTGLLKRGKQQYHTICQQPSARLEFRQKLACLTDDKIATFHTCMDASVARFEFIRSQVKPENRMPSLCCSYQIFFADTGATIDQLCGRGDRAHDFVHKLITGTTAEFLQLICEGHRSLDDCRRSDKTSESLRNLEQVTKATKAGKVRPQSKSLIPPLLDILDGSSE